MDVKQVAYHAISIREYSDGAVDMQYTRMDPATRRMTSESLGQLQQDDELPLTSSELLLCAAAERVARQLGYQPELPF